MLDKNGPGPAWRIPREVWLTTNENPEGLDSKDAWKGQSFCCYLKKCIPINLGPAQLPDGSKTGQTMAWAQKVIPIPLHISDGWKYPECFSSLAYCMKLPVSLGQGSVLALVWSDKAKWTAILQIFWTAPSNRVSVLTLIVSIEWPKAGVPSLFKPVSNFGNLMQHGGHS